MKPITDEDVAALPLEQERAGLLEAIMSVPVLDTVGPFEEPAPARRRHTALLVGAIAASVVALVVVPVWLGASGDGSEPAPAPDPASAPSDPSDPADARATRRSDGSGIFPVVEDVPEGWELGGVSGEPLVSVALQRPVDGGLMTFLVEIRPAGDRERELTEQETQGGVPAGAVDIDGRTAEVWRLTEKAGAGGPGPCGNRCVTHWSAITPVEDGHYALVIGAGLNDGTLQESEWRALVAGVRLTDRGAFEDWLPEDVVLPAKEGQVVADALSGVPLPPGFEADEIELPDYTDRSGAAFQVGVAAVCAWLEVVGRDPAGPAELRNVDSWPLYAELERVERQLLATIAAQEPEAVGAC